MKRNDILKADNFIDNVEKQMSFLYEDKNHRDKSFEQCYTFFKENRKDNTKRDLIALHLYAYLASWGMLRNSFLMQKDYLFHRPIVDILCDRKYDELMNINPFCDENIQSQIELIFELSNEIKKCYSSFKYLKKGDRWLEIKVSDTFLTKILLGTFGCIPAYDTYLKCGLKEFGICQTFNEKSAFEIFKFAKENKAAILEETMNIKSKQNMEYPVLKIVDSYLWIIGRKMYEIKNTNKHQNIITTQ